MPERSPSLLPHPAMKSILTARGDKAGMRAWRSLRKEYRKRRKAMPMFTGSQVQELRAAGLLPFCGEWITVAGAPQRCTARAEFILWGKLISPHGLGPRCYDHAASHVGHDALNRPGERGYAVADLRPLIRDSGVAL